MGTQIEPTRDEAGLVPGRRWPCRVVYELIGPGGAVFRFDSREELESHVRDNWQGEPAWESAGAGEGGGEQRQDHVQADDAVRPAR